MNGHANANACNVLQRAGESGLPCGHAVDGARNAMIDININIDGADRQESEKQRMHNRILNVCTACQLGSSRPPSAETHRLIAPPVTDCAMHSLRATATQCTGLSLSKAASKDGAELDVNDEYDTLDSSDSEQEHEHEINGEGSSDSSNDDEFRWLPQNDALFRSWQLDDASMQHEFQLRDSRRARPLGLPPLPRNVIRLPAVPPVQECSEPSSSTRSVTASGSTDPNSLVSSPRGSQCSADADADADADSNSALGDAVEMLFGNDLKDYMQDQTADLQIMMEMEMDVDEQEGQSLPFSPSPHHEQLPVYYDDADHDAGPRITPITFILILPAIAMHDDVSEHSDSTVLPPPSQSQSQSDHQAVVPATDGDKGKLDLKLTITTARDSSVHKLQSETEKVQRLASQVQVAVGRHGESTEGVMIDVLVDNSNTLCASIRNFRKQLMNSNSTSTVVRKRQHSASNLHSSDRVNHRLAAPLFLSEIRLEEATQSKEELISHLRSAVRTILNRSNLLGRPAVRQFSKSSSALDTEGYTAMGSNGTLLMPAESANSLMSEDTLRSANSITSCCDDATLDSLTDAVMLKVFDQLRQVHPTPDDSSSVTIQSSEPEATVIQLKRSSHTHDGCDNRLRDTLRGAPKEHARFILTPGSARTPAESHQTNENDTQLVSASQAKEASLSVSIAVSNRNRTNSGELEPLCMRTPDSQPLAQTVDLKTGSNVRGTECYTRMRMTEVAKQHDASARTDLSGVGCQSSTNAHTSKSAVCSEISRDGGASPCEQEQEQKQKHTFREQRDDAASHCQMHTNEAHGRNAAHCEHEERVHVQHANNEQHDRNQNQNQNQNRIRSVSATHERSSDLFKRLADDIGTEAECDSTPLHASLTDTLGLRNGSHPALQQRPDPDPGPAGPDQDQLSSSSCSTPLVARTRLRPVVTDVAAYFKKPRTTDLDEAQRAVSHLQPSPPQPRFSAFVHPAHTLRQPSDSTRLVETDVDSGQTVSRSVIVETNLDRFATGNELTNSPKCSLPTDRNSASATATGRVAPSQPSNNAHGSANMSVATRIPLTLVEFDDAAVLDRTQSQSHSQSSLINGKSGDGSYLTPGFDCDGPRDRERSYSQYELRVLKSLEKLSVPQSLVEQAREKMLQQRCGAAVTSAVRSMENLTVSSPKSTIAADTKVGIPKTPYVRKEATTQRGVVVRTQPTYRSLNNLHNNTNLTLAQEQKCEPVRIELPSAKFRQRNEKLVPIQSSLPKSFDEFKKSLPNLAHLTRHDQSDAAPHKHTNENGSSSQHAEALPVLRLTVDDFRYKKHSAPNPTTASRTFDASVARKKNEKEELVKRLAAYEVEKAAMSKAPPLPLPSFSMANDNTLVRPSTDNVCAFVRRKAYELTRLVAQSDCNAVAASEALRRFSNSTEPHWTVESVASRLIYATLDATVPLRFITSRDDAFYPRCEAFLAKLAAHSDAMRIASQVARAGATLFGNGVVLFMFAQLADLDAYLNDSRDRVYSPSSLPLRAFVTFASVRDVRQYLITCAGVGVRTLADLACLYDPASHFVLACALYSGEMVDFSRRERRLDAERCVDATCKWQCVELHPDLLPTLTSSVKTSSLATNVSLTSRSPSTDRPASQKTVDGPARPAEAQPPTASSSLPSQLSVQLNAQSLPNTPNKMQPVCDAAGGEELRRRARETRFFRIQRTLRTYGVNLRQLQPNVHEALVDYVEENKPFDDAHFSFTAPAPAPAPAPDGDDSEVITYSCVISVNSDDLEPQIARVSGGPLARPITWWNTLAPTAAVTSPERSDERAQAQGATDTHRTSAPVGVQTGTAR